VENFSSRPGYPVIIVHVQDEAILAQELGICETVTICVENFGERRDACVGNHLVIHVLIVIFLRLIESQDQISDLLGYNYRHGRVGIHPEIHNQDRHYNRFRDGHGFLEHD